MTEIFKMTMYRKVLIVLINILIGVHGFSQGPPITGDKAIMLAPGNVLIKTLTEYRNLVTGSVLSAPLMVHYLPTANTLVGLHIPFVSYDDLSGIANNTLGDIQFLAKYQFIRKDQMGKTFRMVVKTLQTLPTGDEIGMIAISTGDYQSYVGILAGYETLAYGIISELGYNVVPSGTYDELRYKLGFGLPLKKQTYPVNQVNLYFEYQSSWFTSIDDYMLLFSQGIQYAKKQTTFEIAVQFPLSQKIVANIERDYSLYMGTRYVF